MAAANSEGDGAITALLTRWSQGREDALPALMELVYDDLRRLARRHLRAEIPGQTIQPTALVHEIFVELARQRKLGLKDRVHFAAVVSLMMRRYLVKRARRRRAQKRDGIVVALDERAAVGEEGGVDVIALHEALGKLAVDQPRAAKVVEMRYFAGMSHAEIAELLGVSLITVKRDWTYARCRLLADLEPES